MFASFFEKIYRQVAAVPFDALCWFTFSAFFGIYAAALALTLAARRFRTLCKRPFLCFVNAYTAVVFALFLTRCELAPSLFAAALFWLAGYLLYGTLCLASARRAPARPSQGVRLLAEPSAPPPRRPPSAGVARADLPAARSSVRLEHALSVTRKLLEKSPGRSDRQELERMESTLSLLQTKGTLSAEESDILNEYFNALLKLMAKYNV